MQWSDFEYVAAVVTAALLALSRVIPLLFATVKLCVREYYAFRAWLREVRRRPDRPEA